MIEQRHIIMIVIIAIPAAMLLTYLVPFALWKYTKDAGLKIGFFPLASLRIQRLPAGKLMRALKCAKDNDFDVKLSDLIKHHKAGGDVIRWLEGAAMAKEAGIELTLEKAAELELDGLEIMKVAEILNQIPEKEQAV